MKKLLILSVLIALGLLISPSWAEDNKANAETLGKIGQMVKLDFDKTPFADAIKAFGEAIGAKTNIDAKVLESTKDVKITFPGKQEVNGRMMLKWLCDQGKASFEVKDGVINIIPAEEGKAAPGGMGGM